MEKIMISIIIPTMYKSPRLPKLIQDLEQHNLVSEILLIEDTPSIYMDGMLDNITTTKTIIYPFTKKRYCNGVWNFGVSKVKNHFYALCNDDINFNTNIIDDVLYFYQSKPNMGFVGMHHTSYIYQKSEMYAIQKNNPNSENYGWGCLIFNHKNNNVFIPDDLKNYFGDNFYRENSKLQNWDYIGHKIETEMSTTLKNVPMDLDRNIWKSKYKKHHG